MPSTTKELAEAETANRAVDSIQSGPVVREIESLKITEATGRTVAMDEANTDQVVERADGASRQLDENQNVTTGATKQRAGTQLTPNNVEGCVGCLRSFDGHQAEQADWMLSVEAIKKSSANTTDDVSHRYDSHTGKLRNRDYYIARRKEEFDEMEVFSGFRRVKKSEAIDGAHVRMKEMCKLHYEFEEFAHRKVEKVIEEMEQVKFMEKRDDTSQQRQIGHVVTDMDEFIYAHPPRGAEIVLSYGYCSKLILEQEESHDCGRSFFAMHYNSRGMDGTQRHWSQMCTTKPRT